MKIITTRNVYTGAVMDLCAAHDAAQANGDAQVQQGLHHGSCDACGAIEQHAEREYFRGLARAQRADWAA